MTPDDATGPALLGDLVNSATSALRMLIGSGTLSSRDAPRVISSLQHALSDTALTASSPVMQAAAPAAGPALSAAADRINGAASVLRSAEAVITAVHDRPAASYETKAGSRTFPAGLPAGRGAAARSPEPDREVVSIWPPPGSAAGDVQGRPRGQGTRPEDAVPAEATREQVQQDPADSLRPGVPATPARQDPGSVDVSGWDDPLPPAVSVATVTDGTTFPQGPAAGLRPGNSAGTSSGQPAHGTARRQPDQNPRVAGWAR